MIILLILLIGIGIDYIYKPRLEITRERDLLLFYTNKFGNRVYVKLFKI